MAHIRFVAVAAAAVAFQTLSTVAAWSQGREDVHGADVAGTVPPPAAMPAPVVWQQPLLTFDNGPLITHPGEGCGSASRVQDLSLGLGTLGFSASTATGFRIADDFLVSAPGWTVNTVAFFAYQTNSTPTCTFNTVRVQIWHGPPNAGGAVVYGDTTTNRFSTCAFGAVGRDSESAPGGCARPVMMVWGDIGTTLAPGAYWLDFQLGGTLPSGPFAPPTTVLGSTSPCTPCNGLQWNPGTSNWVALNDGGTGTPQDVKFIIDYTPVPVELQSFRVE